MKHILSTLLLMATLSLNAWAAPDIPIKAWSFVPIIKQEVASHFPEIPYPEYVPALMEKESCITLKHSRCFSSTAQLKTDREKGVGVGQITIAYNKDGSVRFDKLSEMTERYKKELPKINWNNIREKPEAQVRIMVLMLRDDYRALYNVEDEYQRTAMMDAAYNGGRGSVHKERRICGMAKNCDPDIWFGHVERYCSKSKKPMPAYGNRSICDIHRDHVKSVMKSKLPKYVRAKFLD